MFAGLHSLSVSTRQNIKKIKHLKNLICICMYVISIGYGVLFQPTDCICMGTADSSLNNLANKKITIKTKSVQLKTLCWHNLY